MAERLLLVREVATLLRVSNMTVYRLIKAGALPATRVGKNFRLHPDDVAGYLTAAHSEAQQTVILAVPVES